MSLEELEAQAEAQEDEATEQPGAEKESGTVDVDAEAAATERETFEKSDKDETEEPEAEEAEESDDFELELEGEPEPDQQKYDPVEVLQHKLSRERKKKREARSEVDELRDQVKQLTQLMQGGQQQAPQQQAPQQAQSMAEPKVPDLYDPGIDGDRDKFDRAQKQFWRDWKAYESRHQEAEQVQTQYRERMEDMTKSLATRAAKFSQENKVSVDRVADALDKATSEIDQSTGIDGSSAYLLDSVGDGGERVAYYIGTNTNAMSKIKQLLQEDKQGFKAIAHMTRLSEKLKPKHSKRVSSAPDPDQPLKGDGSTAQSRKLQEQYDKASESTNFERMREIKRKAEKLGVKLN